MPLKQKQVVMFLFAALFSALLTIIFPSTQQVSAADCEGSSCDSLVNIDGIDIGKIDDNKILNTEDINDKILNTEDINKILGDDNTVVEKIQSTDNGAEDATNNNNNNDKDNKIRIKDLNVLIDDDDNKPKVKVLPDNDTVIEIKDFKILIPSK